MTGRSGPQRMIAAAVHTPGGVRRWTLAPEALALDASAGSPWLLVPPETRQAFDALAAAGVPLSESVFGSPLLGVKCGCNEAFLVSLDPAAATETEFVRVWSVRHGARTRTGLVERRMLRPVVRGRTVGRWAVTRRSASGQPQSDPAVQPIGQAAPERHCRTGVDSLDARGERHWSRRTNGRPSARRGTMAGPVAPPAGCSK